MTANVGDSPYASSISGQSPWGNEGCLLILDYRLPSSSVHGILQARILEWVAISFSRGSSQPRNRTQVPSTGRQVLYCLENPVDRGAWQAGSPWGLKESDTTE